VIDSLLELAGPLPPLAQVAALLPLALAAGLDLPLTLLLVGSALSLGFQSAPPGELSQLAIPQVLVMAGLLWIVEPRTIFLFGATWKVVGYSTPRK
jgi:hypothetical protein